jgi:nitrous oxidase accessory protein
MDLPHWLLPLCLLVGLVPDSATGQPLPDRIDAATPGDTLVLDGGTHAGPFVIDTPLVLTGRNGAHLQGDDSTHVVTITADGVTLQGFRITDSGKQLSQDHAGVMVRGHRATIRNNRLSDVLHGVYVKGTNRAVIAGNRIEGPPTVMRRLAPAEARAVEGCSVPPDGGRCAVPLASPQRGNGIHLWNARHSTITHNTVRRTRDGTYFSHSDHTYTAHNTIRDVRYGLHFMYSDHNAFEHNVFTDNASGSALMYSDDITVRHNDFRNNRSQRGYGLLLQSITDSRFADNRLTGNTTGLYLENSSRSDFRRNEIRSNYRGLRLTGSSMHNRFTENVIRSNLQTVALSGMSATNAWHVEGRGNFWGTRGLLDLNADGVSELPHRVVDVLAVERTDFPAIGLLASSPGIETLAFALRRAPLPTLPEIVDPHALMRAPVATGAPPRRPLALGMALALFVSTLTVIGWGWYDGS